MQVVVSPIESGTLQLEFWRYRQQYSMLFMVEERLASRPVRTTAGSAPVLPSQPTEVVGNKTVWRAEAQYDTDRIQVTFDFSSGADMVNPGNAFSVLDRERTSAGNSYTLRTILQFADNELLEKMRDNAGDVVMQVVTSQGFESFTISKKMLSVLRVGFWLDCRLT